MTKNLLNKVTGHTTKQADATKKVIKEIIAANPNRIAADPKPKNRRVVSIKPREVSAPGQVITVGTKPKKPVTMNHQTLGRLVNADAFEFAFDAKTARSAGYKVRTASVKLHTTAGAYVTIQHNIKNVLEYMHQLRATPKLKMSADSSITKQLNERNKFLTRLLAQRREGENRFRLINVAASAVDGLTTIKFAAINDVKKEMTIYTVELIIAGDESTFTQDYAKITRNRGITSDQLRERIFAL